MNRLTREERRRVYENQVRLGQAVLDRRAGPGHRPRATCRRGILALALKMGPLLLLAGAGLLVLQVVDLHPPASLLEGLLPRL